MQKGFLAMLVLSLLIAIFAISNSAVVVIDFIFAEILLSQAIVIFICVLLGATIAGIFGWIRQIAFKKEIKELSKENKALKEEVAELKVQGEKVVQDLDSGNITEPDEITESNELIDHL